MDKNIKKWGDFSPDGKEFIITNFKTPYPWVNIICPKEYGIIVSQMGCGFSWYKSAKHIQITKWTPSIHRDECGKFFIIQDENNQFSPVPYPFEDKIKNYSCHHGLGYSRFFTQTKETKTELLLFVPSDFNFEVYRLKIKNTSAFEKNYTIKFHLQFWMGSISEAARELHRLFYRGKITDGILWMKKVAWQKLNKKGQFLNQEFPVMCFATALPSPQIKLDMDKSEPEAEIKLKINLSPHKEKEIIFLLGVNTEKSFLKKLTPEKIEKFFQKTKKYWFDLISGEKANTPYKKINHLLNYWLKYQTISSRLNGKTGYYQIGSAIGFRDQLQDSMLFLRTKPELTKRQIFLHASRQFKKGDVAHFWDPLTGEFARLKISDNLLWLVFVTVEYLKITGDFSILHKKIKFLDSGNSSLKEHCLRAINLVIERRSKRGIPLILAGDWNDGLSAVGWEGKGESFWLAMFLYKILTDWDNLISKKKFTTIRRELKNAVNKYGWDGNWFIRATKDNGKPIGSRENKYGKIFLNSQTWAIISGITSPERVKKILKSLDRYLYYPYGPLLLWPAYENPDEEIGYLTRYASGTRENGAVYVHAATWAVWAEVIAGRKEKAWQIFKSILPITQKQSTFWAEPYVTSANIEGPSSTHPGRGSWSWYTGSAQWLLKVYFEYLT